MTFGVVWFIDLRGLEYICNEASERMGSTAAVSIAALTLENIWALTLQQEHSNKRMRSLTM